MPLVTSKDMLRAAQLHGYAVAAFNIENMEMAQAVVEAATEARAPVILQTTPSTVGYASVALFAGIAKALAARADVPVALHLDHGSSFALAAQALDAGYTSVMIDGSALPFLKNVELARQVVEAAAGRAPVEAELGKVGGKEDDLEAGANTNTDPLEAAEYVERTGIDALAVAIGTAHGVYIGTPVLDKELLKTIRKAVSIPLVLHGASGLSDADVRDCISYGICKVNFATELRIAYTEGVKQALRDAPELYDPKRLGVAGKTLVKKLALEKMTVCGCAGKA